MKNMIRINSSMKYKLKNIAACILLLSFVFILASCDHTVEYTRKDAEKHLKEKGITKYTISEEQREITSEEYGKEMCWDVETDHYGLGEPLKFVVIDRYYSSKFGVSNSLIDTASKEIEERLRTLYEPTGELSYYKDIDDSDYAFFAYPLRGRESFYKAYEEVMKFQEFLSNYPNLSNESFLLDYYIPDEKDGRSAADSFINARGYSLRITQDHPTKDEYDRIIREGTSADVRGSLSKYLEKCLELGLLDRIDEFSQEEIDWCIEDSHSNGSRGITKVMDADLNVVNEKVVYAWRNGRIPYGSLYRLSEERGLELTGDWWDYSVAGADGNTYSYSYADAGAEDKDPELAVEEASRILGILLDDGMPFYELTFERSLLESLKMTPPELAHYIVDNSELTDKDVTVEVDRVTVRAKEWQLKPIIEANEEKMTSIGSNLERVDPEFTYHQSNVYLNLRIRVKDEKSEILKNHMGQVDELIALGYFNRALVDPEAYCNPEFSETIRVEVYYTVRNGYTWKDHTINSYDFEPEEGEE